MSRTNRHRRPGAPPLVTVLNPIAKALLGAGVPMGFNGLITIRGRTSGLPRTTPRGDHRRSPAGGGSGPRGATSTGCGTCAPRAARPSPCEAGTRTSRATELDPTQRVDFFRDVLGPSRGACRSGSRSSGPVDGVDLDHPVEGGPGPARSSSFSRS